MTEKRFLYVLDNDEDTIYDLFDKNILSKKDIEEKMNELHEENKELMQFKEQVFNLIDKKLEENKELDGVDTAMYYANEGTLNEFKKELQRNDW